MITFTKEKKEALLGQIQKHRDADQILQGTYGEGTGKNWRGCAVGCSIHSLNILEKKDYVTSDHTIYEKELGIPEAIARLEDRIFEGLPKEIALDWPKRFIEAVNPETDLSLVLPKFYIKILIDKKHGVKQYAFEDGKKAIDMTVLVYKNHIKKGSIDESAAWSAAESAESAARSAARSAAWSAAWSAAESAESAARSAAWSAAESAAWSAAWSAARSAAESAAWSAAWSAARSAAWSAHYEWMADILIDILKETK